MPAFLSRALSPWGRRGRRARNLSKTYLRRAQVYSGKTTTLHQCAAVPWRLVFKAHRLLYHSTLGLRVIKKRRREEQVSSGNAHERARGWTGPVQLLNLILHRAYTSTQRDFTQPLVDDTSAKVSFDCSADLYIASTSCIERSTSSCIERTRHGAIPVQVLDLFHRAVGRAQ